MSRQAGWYWVKGMLGCDDWSPSYWDSRLARWDSLIPDGDEIEAGPRIPTPGEPWQCVPVEPTGGMEDAIRGFLILLSSGSPIAYGRARRHVKMYHGPEALAAWPAYAQGLNGHITKAAQADIMYRMMLAAAPKPGGEE